MKELDKILDTLKDEMLDTLREWVRIPSVATEAAPGAPFGPVVREMLDKALADCEKLGFQTENFDGFIGHADMGTGDDEDALAILAHLDVVPQGDGWTKQPFGAEVHDGKLYGRGTSDDKGPAVAALYAMRAVQLAGIPLKRKVRLILGCDEESSWLDIEHYNKVAHMPRMGFSPDASYPVINIEKGMCGLELTATPAKEGLQVVAFNVGERPNVIPGTAVATVRGGHDLVGKTARIAERYGWPVEAKEENGLVTISAQGITGHAAHPEGSRNAIGQVLLTLRDLGAVGPIQVLADAIGTQYDGEGLGIQVSDRISGPLTCNLGIIRADEQQIKARLDIRFPLLVNPDMLEHVIRQHVPGFTVSGARAKTPHYVPENSELVQALLSAYHEVSGLPKHTIAIGGGTYARSLKEGVAFGALFPDEPDVAHKADESIDIGNLYKSMRIIAHAIVKLAGA
ncbi:MAG: dipeptidase PepV [Clostridiales bacterium]|mgnify:CR=1 FL=1|nr:dipeptidase PepV [Clostridiales bacterium]